jgi:methionyl-tRNA synthetase (EC 6.1.1.10)
MVEITIEDFSKVDLRVCKVIEAKRVEGTNKLLLLKVDLGNEVRTVVSGIGDQFKPEDLLGKNLIIVANLKPKVIRGIESKGMILCAVDDKERVYPLTTLIEASPGLKVY